MKYSTAETASFCLDLKPKGFEEYCTRYEGFTSTLTKIEVAKDIHLQM
jgi:hypothetical protein